MKYYFVKILTRDIIKDKLGARVDGHYVKDKNTFFPRVDRDNDNTWFPNNFFFDFLAVDETINLGMRVRNFVLKDAMAWEGECPSRYSFTITPKLKTVLEQFNLAPSRFFDAKLRSKYLFYDYFVVQFLKDSYLELIHLSKCIFCKYRKDKPFTDPEEYQVNSLLDIEIIEDEMRDERNKKRMEGLSDKEYFELPRSIGLKKLILKKAAKDIDMMWHDLSNTFIISERLKDALIENNITGIEIKEIEDVEIVVEE
jgi:hypothetical protein